jgi:serine protease Do
LEGYLNGEKLQPATSFARALSPQVEAQNPAATTESYAGFTTVADQSGAIELDVPAAWTDVDLRPWTDETGKTVGAGIIAATDRAAFLTHFGTPGVFFGASSSLAKAFNPTSLLDSVKTKDTFRGSKCTLVSRETYEDPVYKGAYDVYKACDGTDAGMAVVAAAPEDNAYVLLLRVQLLGDGDLTALDRILDSFQVVGPLP